MVRTLTCIALAALCSLAFAAEVRAASLYSTQCQSITGADQSDPAISVTSVTITQRTGTLPTNEVHRREHVRISAGLATALGIAAGDISLNDESRQLRIAYGTVSANFTVDAIDATDPGNTVAVWLPTGVSGGSFTDKDNGFFKLFGFQDPSTVFASTKTGTVWDMAPSATFSVSGGVVTRQSHFTEPSGVSTKQFRECVELRGDDALAVLVPHGGNIETSISAQVPNFLTDLDGYGYEPSVWEGSGVWGNNETFEHWHVTSPQISGESFPGYGDLEASGSYTYAVALHGFSRSERAVVLGGRSSRQAKCHLILQIEDHLATTSDDQRITYKVYGPDGASVDVIRDSTGAGDTPAALTGVSGLAGLDVENIVNRVSPNATGARGSGGIQLEMSSGLRGDATLFARFIEGLAIGLDEELSLPATTTTDFCAQL